MRKGFFVAFKARFALGISLFSARHKHSQHALSIGCLSNRLRRGCSHSQDQELSTVSILVLAELSVSSQRPQQLQPLAKLRA